MSDSAIAAAMDMYGVTPAMMAQAVGIPVEQVQQRYEEVQPQGLFTAPINAPEPVYSPEPEPVYTPEPVYADPTYADPFYEDITSVEPASVAPEPVAQPILTQPVITPEPVVPPIISLETPVITPAAQTTQEATTMAVTSKQIIDFLLANPNMTDAQIVGAMEQYGVSPAQMATAVGLKEGEVISRVAATIPEGQTITLGDTRIAPQYEVRGSGEDRQVVGIENITVEKTTGDINYKSPVGSEFQNYSPTGEFTGTGKVTSSGDKSFFGGLVDAFKDPVVLAALGGAAAGGLFGGAGALGGAATGAGTSLGTGLTAGAGGLGLSTTGAGLGALGTGAGITAGTGLGTGVLTGSTLGTSLLGAGALTGAGVLGGTTLGTTGAGASGLGAGSSLGTGITAGAGGLGLSTTGAGLGTLGTGAGITAGTGLTGTGVLTGSGLGSTLLGTGAGALTGTGVLTGSGLGTTLLGTGAGTGVTGGVTGLGTGTLGTGALTTGVGTGLGTGLNVNNLANLLSGGLGTAGSLLQMQQSKEAALAAQQRIDAETAAAKQSAQFRPIGMTTRFGTSQFAVDPVTGQLTSAGYTLSPEAKNAQDRLVKLAESGLQQAEGAQAQFAPLQTGAQSLFKLGQGYLAQSPETVASDYMKSQLALLAPGREQQYAFLQNQLQQQGRGGLSVAQGTGLAPTSPELAAFMNAKIQEDARLAANAQQYGQQNVLFGAGLLGQGSQAMGQYYGGQQAAYAPYTNALGQVQGLETAAQQPLTMGLALGKEASQAGARVGELGLGGARLSTALGTSANATTNPYAQALMAAGNPNAMFGQSLGNVFGGLFS